jgi:hypothetical protein
MGGRYIFQKTKKDERRSIGIIDDASDTEFFELAQGGDKQGHVSFLADIQVSGREEGGRAAGRRGDARLRVFIFDVEEGRRKKEEGGEGGEGGRRKEEGGEGGEGGRRKEEE